MRQPMYNAILFVSTFLLLFVGCEDSVQPTTPPAGPATMTVKIQGRDEYSRAERFPGGARIVLAGRDREWTGTIPEGDTSYSFYGLPYETYIVEVTKDGYSRCHFRQGILFGIDQRMRTVDIYKLPGADFHVDSITCAHAPGTQDLTVRVVMHLPLPAGGHVHVAVFLGRNADVSEDLDTYFYSSETNFGYNSKDAGNSVVELPLHVWAPDLAPQTLVYVTARLGTEASREFRLDSTYAKWIYTELEHNSTAVTTFAY